VVDLSIIAIGVTTINIAASVKHSTILNCLKKFAKILNKNLLQN